MKSISYKYLYFFVMVTLLGCAGTRKLPRDKKLYTGSKIDFMNNTGDNRNIRESLKELLHPEPNVSILGMRPRLWVYNITGQVKKDKGFKHWLKYKVGEPPALFSDVDAGSLSGQMEDRIINKGFFDGAVMPEINEKNKKAEVIYHVKPGNPYFIRKIHFPDSSIHMNEIIAGQKKYCLFEEGDRFDLEKMADERKRIEDILLDSGYFHFNYTFLTFEADSTVGNHRVDLYFKLKDNIPDAAKRRFKISSITILPGYSADTAGLGAPVRIDSMLYYLNPDEIRARPVVNNIRLHPGRHYSREDEDISISRLAGLNVFRYININYEEDTSRHYLKPVINLVPYKRKSIRLQLNAVSESNNFVGPFFSLSFLNRNFFGGGEQFQASLNTGIETQLNTSREGPLNSFELGLNTSLSVPLLVIPFRVNESDSKYDFKTKYGIGIRSQRRIGFFNLVSMDLMTGYSWNKDVVHRFEVFPVNINYFKLSNTSPKFRDLLDANRYLRNAYQEQFILGGRYAYYYNSGNSKNRFTRPDNFYFNVNLNTSGNILRFIQQTLTRSPEGQGNEIFRIGGLPYAQFSKVDLDFRYYHKFDYRNRLATRFVAGTGFAYGNSDNLPYTHQFAIGGASSIRAFRPRSIGPGAYSIPDSLVENSAFIDQTADIKLEWNIEYRFDLYKDLKGAVFVDAGNIWTMRDEENRADAKFNFSNFYKQIAIGTGLGIRYDLTFLILRLDVATPVRVPNGPENSRWVIDDIAINKKKWRKKNLLFNFGIGYPF